MKRIFKLLPKILLILFLLIVLIIIGLIIALYDSKDVTNYEVIDKQTPSQLVFNNVLYDGTYDVYNTKEAEVLFSESELEALVYPVIMSLNQEGMPFEITGVDIDVNNGVYSFEASVTLANFFKTVLTAKLNIENKDNLFSINFKNIKLGDISATKIAKFLIKNIDVNKLQNELINKNIYVNVDLSTFTITCTYDDINKMIKANVPDKQSSLISLLFDVFLTNQTFMDLSFGDNDLLGAFIHLGTAEFKESIEGKLQYTYSFDMIADAVSNLLDEKLISYEDVNTVYNFLVRGYESLEDEEKSKINEIDFGTLLSKAEVKNYKGIIQKSNITLIDYMNEIFKEKNIFELTSLLKDGIQLSDDFLTSLLQSFDYMGYSYAFSNDDNKVGYFVLEQLNLIFKDEFVEIHLVMNLNGLQLYLEASFDCLDENSKGLKINGEIHDVKIGDYVLNDSQKDDLIVYLGDLLNSLEWIIINEENKGIELDFSNAMMSIVSNNNLLNSLIGNSINSITKTYIEDGKVTLKFELNTSLPIL